MQKNKIKKLLLKSPLFISLFFAVWWMVINYTSGGNMEGTTRDNFTDTYALIAFTGAIAGFVIAKNWGFLKSRFGKTLFFFSLGLFMQFLGHFTYTMYFRVGGVELAFPSIGDLFYLSTSIFYILALYNLIKLLVGGKSVWRPRRYLFIGLFTTLILFWLSYISFLNIAIQDERGLIYQIVNVAYPFMQVFYFSIGFIALIQSKKMYRGKLFKPVTIILLALFLQYFTDFHFLYISYHDLWIAGGVNDLLWVIAYSLMIVGILMIDDIRLGLISDSKEKQNIGTEVGRG